jgi:hypothetical protein
VTVLTMQGPRRHLRRSAVRLGLETDPPGGCRCTSAVSRRARATSSPVRDGIVAHVIPRDTPRMHDDEVLAALEEPPSALVLRRICSAVDVLLRMRGTASSHVALRAAGLPLRGWRRQRATGTDSPGGSLKPLVGQWREHAQGDHCRSASPARGKARPVPPRGASSSQRRSTWLLPPRRRRCRPLHL